MAKEKIDETIREQILEVRDTGQTNMFDLDGVMRVAYELDLYELVNYLDDKANHKSYCNFILYGDEDAAWGFK